MQNLKERILKAAKAESIPQGVSGSWSVTKLWLDKEFDLEARRANTLPPGVFTSLFCATDEALKKSPRWPYELVMHDHPKELNKHLDFMLKARGRVLVLGLGLGCVVRGLLANPAVRHVTIIERSDDVIDLVWPHMPEKKRLTLVRSDAVEYVRRTRRRFDCAWYDLWSDPDKKEPHLAVTHQQVIIAMRDRVGFHGAWDFPRWARSICRKKFRTEII